MLTLLEYSITNFREYIYRDAPWLIIALIHIFSKEKPTFNLFNSMITITITLSIFGPQFTGLRTYFLINYLLF